MCNKVSRETTKIAIQRDMLKTIIDKSKWISKKWSSNSQEGRKKENRKMKKIKHRENKN